MKRLGALYDGRGRRAVTSVKLWRVSVRRGVVCEAGSRPAVIWQSY